MDIETSEGIIAIAQAGKALVVNSRGMKEFQVIGRDPAVIALTLFKSTGVLGRSDLDWRPGRASGINNTVVDTPDAQLLKPLHFSFTVALADNADHLGRCASWRIRRRVTPSPINDKRCIPSITGLSVFRCACPNARCRQNFRYSPYRNRSFFLPCPMRNDRLARSPACSTPGRSLSLFRLGWQSVPSSIIWKNTCHR